MDLMAYHQASFILSLLLVTKANGLSSKVRLRIKLSCFIYCLCVSVKYSMRYNTKLELKIQTRSSVCSFLYIRFYSYNIVNRMSLCSKLRFHVHTGLKIDEFSREKMDITAKELMEEKSLAYSCLN